MQRWISTGVVLLLFVLVFGLLIPAIHQAREAARKSTSKNNLKQIGLAVGNYADSHRCLPSGGVIREDGTALQGWMTMYLPFMDASADFNRVNMQAAWNSLVNRNVTETVRSYYLNPSVRANSTSTGYGVTHYLGNPHLYYRNSSVTFEQMERGTAHTWVTGEVAGEFQPWAYPFNWRPLGTQLCNGPGSFGFPAWQGGHLLFADGSVSFFSEKTSSAILEKFAAAPPVPNREQMAVPEKRFETGIFYWKHMSLQTEPDRDYTYYAKVLENSDQQPVLIQLFRSNHRELSEEEQQQMNLEDRRTFSVPRLMLQIDKTTDLPQALKDSPLSEDTNAAQMQVILNRLDSLQKQLP